MTDHPLVPHLDQRVAIVGQSGSGKTYTARGAVEAASAAGHRLCVIDPLDVWWGLGAGEDGSPLEGRPVIFGGRHADVPITEESGAIVGRVIAGSRESSIVSLGGFGSDASLRRFCDAFLEALFDHNRAPLLLVVDEADILAPQNPQKGFERLLGRMQNIVRRGRVLGLVPWLITQRPAVLSKDVLSQAEVLVSMNLKIKHDRDAIGGWIQGNADKETGDRILGELPRLPVGTGYIWAPAEERLERVEFPRIVTFDSSRTPKRGESIADVSLRPLDVGAITAAIAAITDQAPSQQATQRQRAMRATTAILDAEEVNRQVYEEGHAIGYRIGHAAGMLRAFEIATGHLETLRRQFNGLAGDVEALLAATPTDSAIDVPPASPPAAAAGPRKTSTTRPVAATPPAKPQPPAKVGQPADGVTPTQQRVINAIGWWRAMGQHPVERLKACVVAGYSPKASTYGVYISELVKSGYVEVSPGKVGLTAKGIAAAIVPPTQTRQQIRAAVADLLEPQERRVFDAIYAAYPGEISRKALAEQLGLSPTASTLGVYISGVSAYRVVETSSPGHVRAAAWLFPTKGGR